MIRVFDTKEELGEAAVDLFVERNRVAKATFSVALAGGSTPKAVYELLAKPENANRVDWGKTMCFWGDERWVPPSDDQSNEGMARKALLDHVPISPSQIWPMFGVDETPEDGARRYETTLRGQFPNPDETFDLLLLGIGTDGHTASLFPGDRASLSADAWVVPTTSPAGVPQRLSLTPAALWAASLTVFMVVGPDKALPLSRVLTDGSDLPAAVVARNSRDVIWLLDREAASLVQF